MAAELQGALVDRATQRWVIATGRQVSFAEHAWLDGPVGAPDRIDDRWIAQHAERIGARLEADPAAGLLPDLSVLDGPGFDAGAADPRIRAFYETTARFELDVWSRWSRWAEPGGRLLNTVFARRLRQLSLPLDPLDASLGMTSRVIALRGADGRHVGTAWQRTLRRTGATVFGGFYGSTTAPGSDRPSVRVVFPLPNGSVTVLLRPHTDGRGGLRLVSPAGPFGSEGAYLIVRPAAAAMGWARRVPLPEVFELSTDIHGDVRCDHRLCLGSAEVLRLHYRAREAPGPTTV